MHWILVGFLGLLGLVLFVGAVLGWLNPNRHSAEADAKLVQSHCTLVQTPVDWQENHWA